MRNQKLARKVMFLISAGSLTNELDTTNTIILYFRQNIESGVIRKRETYIEVLG